MGIEEDPVLFQMTANVMVQSLQITLGMCAVNMYMVMGTFRHDFNVFEGFGEMG
jgi:hypothetical protein